MTSGARPADRSTCSRAGEAEARTRRTVVQRGIDEARQAIDGLLNLKPDFTVTDLDKFAPHADRAYVQYLEEGLRIAGLDRADGAEANG